MSHSIASSQTLISLNREHRRLYPAMLKEAAAQSIIEEPRNRGTAPAILHALMRIAEEAPSAIVSLFPSDHYIGNDTLFADYLNSAFKTAALLDYKVVLLAAEARKPEQAYGWIVPELSLASAGQNLFRVSCFVEKPNSRRAHELWQIGALWITFIIVGRVSALLQMFIMAMPRLYGSFSDIRPLLGTVFEADAVARLYEKLPVSGFSELILERCAANLMVMPMAGIEWCDLGEPERAMQVANQMGIRPQWAEA